jgi:hypothetical protein
MGCWNETCGLTQMPICGGDPVRMFLIVENAYPRGSRDVCISYGSELWRPFGLPLKGTYDEYGRLENIEEDCMSDFLLESLREMVVEVPNRMGEVFKREELDWATAIDFVADEGLRVTDPFDVANITKKLDKIFAEVKALVPDLPDNGWSSERSKMADEQKKVVDEDPRVVTMYHMMVHEDVYQAILNYKVPAERFSSWTNGDIKESMRQGAKDYIAQVRQEMAERANMSEKELTAINRMMKLSRSMDMHNRFVSITNHLDGSYGSGSYLRKYLDFVEKRIAEGASDDDPQIQALTEQFVGFASFSQTMTLMRKLWMPQTGKGGQDREYVLHKYMGQVIADFSEKKIKEWDEMMGEYEEEDESKPEE